MRWRVLLELAEAGGAVCVHEVGAGCNDTRAYSAETVGLSLDDAKRTLAALQRHLVQSQVAAHCRQRRGCLHCGAQRPLKDRRSRRLTSLFGEVEVHAPRFGPCRCGAASPRSITPVAEIMPDRCTPEYERMLAKMGALLPYRRAADLLEEVFPLGDAPVIETIRQRTLHVGRRLERDAAAATAQSSGAKAAGSVVLSIDGGHVKSVRSYQARSFEVFVAQASNDSGDQIVFSSMPAEADRQRQQLANILQGLGATSDTPITILSDGAQGPRYLGETASSGPTKHVLDWFHLSMRIQHVAQTVKSWPDATANDTATGARFADAVEHIRWRLWHGQVARALDLIGKTLVLLDAEVETVGSAAAAKVRRVLRDLETYVTGQSDLIIDYGTARRRGEPISTAATESTVQWLLHRRMGAQQQMRWSPRGAHLMLKVRTSVTNQAFTGDYAAAERWAVRPFRRAA
ncbi:MAG: ISKra4 family transposase [Geminicoccaceae bacterium]